MITPTYEFQMSVHARGAAVPGDAIDLPDHLGRAHKVRPLKVSGDVLATATFDCSFESAVEKLAALERMFCEPDGSFVWTSSQGEPAWQVDGNLYDRNDRLLFVDLKGTCPREQFDRLLAALGWPDTRLMFQLTREAVFLDEAEFRRWAAR